MLCMYIIYSLWWKYLSYLISFLCWLVSAKTRIWHSCHMTTLLSYHNSQYVWTCLDIFLWIPIYKLYLSLVTCMIVHCFIRWLCEKFSSLNALHVWEYVRLKFDFYTGVHTSCTVVHDSSWIWLLHKACMGVHKCWLLSKLTWTRRFMAHLCMGWLASDSFTKVMDWHAWIVCSGMHQCWSKSCIDVNWGVNEILCTKSLCSWLTLSMSYTIVGRVCTSVHYMFDIAQKIQRHEQDPHTVLYTCMLGWNFKYALACIIGAWSCITLIPAFFKFCQIDHT